MTEPFTWDAMLAEFRALGAVAENFRLRDGPHGRGLFAIDPSQPVRVFAPPNLLPRRADVIVDGDQLRFAPSPPVGEREAAFLERYYAQFSWDAGGRADTMARLTALDGLPGAIRTLIATEFMEGWLFAPRPPDAVAHRFLASRALGRKGVSVMAPVVELANHAPGAPGFDTADGVQLAGRFAGEVLARYSRTDSFQIFCNWGFASPEPLAFSLPAFVGLSDGRVLAIHRQRRSTKAFKGDAPAPKPQAGGHFVDLARMLIADRDDPARPRALFARNIQTLGEPHPERLFDQILAINQDRFQRLAAAASAHDDPGSLLLRAVCRCQLGALP